MSYPINYPTPQGANVQIFNGSGAPTGSSVTTQDWTKPQGASFVWFTLIGPGGAGFNTSNNPGGSGAVTNFMCPAFLIPDVLRIRVSQGGDPTISDGSPTSVIYQAKDGTGYTLLSANNGTGGGSGGVGSGGAAMTANAFTAMGFFQSVAGQNGVAGNQSASATTFLSGGALGSGATPTITANYGYSGGTSTTNFSGFFQMQPIIVGIGGSGGAGISGQRNGGIGCGGGAAGVAPGGNGGSGLAVIITW